MKRCLAFLFLFFFLITEKATLTWASTSLPKRLSDNPCTHLSIHNAFEGYLHPKSLEAEQVLVNKQPFGLNARDYVKWLVPASRNTGSLNSYYRPSSRNIFEVQTLLIPQEELRVLQAFEGALREPYSSTIDGKPYVRFFIHPESKEHYRSLIEKYPLEDAEGPWCATPSSSARSLFVTDALKKYPPFITKLSVPIKMAGLSRIITPMAVGRAVKATEVLLRRHALSEGRIPQTDKTWEIFPEEVGIYFADNEWGGMLYRGLPPFKENEIAVPWFALVSGEGERWIDVLFKQWQETYSACSQLDFAWEELVKPLVQLHVFMSIEGGMTTEFHTQNVMVKIKNNQVTGLLIKDMDSHWFDYSLIQHRRENHISQLELTEEAAHMLKYGKAQEDQAHAYIGILREKSILRTFPFFLSREDARSLLQRADELVREEFIQRYHRDLELEGHVDDYSLEELFEALHQSITTEEERGLYEQSKQREPRKRTVTQRLYKWLYRAYDNCRSKRVHV